MEEGQSEVVDIFSEQVLGSKGNALQQVNDCRSQQIHQEPNTQSVLVFTLRKKYIQDIALWCDFDWMTTIRYTLHCNEDVVAAHYVTLMADVEKK